MLYLQKIVFLLLTILIYVPLQASHVGSQPLELTHVSELSVADEAAGTVAVQSNNQDHSYELSDVCCDVPSSCQTSCGSCLNSFQTSIHNEYTRLQEVEFSPACIKCSCYLFGACIITGIVVGSILGSDVDYKIYNRESKTIDIIYRPGCGTNTDCVKSVRPNKYLKIHPLGDLTKLCATYAYEWTIFGERECVTQDGLKDRHWYVHDHLTFTRGKGDSSGVNETAQSFSSYKHESLRADAPYYNLRGLISLQKNK